MRKRTDFLQKIYEKNQSTGNYIIAVALDTFEDILNEWDHAPFSKRDIDPDLKWFLESCSEDIPFKHGVELQFFVTKEIPNKSTEEKIIKKFRSYYSFYLREEMRYLGERYRQMVLYTVLAFVFLIIALFFEGILIKNIFTNTILQGLNIGGWVLLWESISFLFFNKGDINDKIREYRRYSQCPISFKYELKNNEGAPSS